MPASPEAAAATALPWLVFGASGQIGQPLLARCRQRQQPLHACTRQRMPESPAGLRWHQASLPDRVPEVGDVGAILSLGPLDLFSAWLQQARLSRECRRVVVVSSMSALSKAGSANPADRALAARLQAAEQAVMRRCDALGIGWTVFRPTLLWGVGRDRSLSRLARFALRWHVLPLPHARGLRQPLHVEDLADMLLAALDTPASCGQLLACGGGEQLSVLNLFQRLRASLPASVLPVPVPGIGLRAAGLLARHSRRAAALARLHTDLVADNAPVQALLGVRPRGFAPRADHWQRPAPA